MTYRQLSKTAALRLTVLLCMVSMSAVGTHCNAQKTINFDHNFFDSTLRVDYHRTGNNRHSSVDLVGYAVKSGPWAGSTTQLLDPFDNGAYRVLLVDAESGDTLYSRCYNSLFREYCDTPEGADSVVSYEEVVNLPLPRQAAQIVMQTRDSLQQFRTMATFAYTPQSPRQQLSPQAKVLPLHHSGDVHHKMDVVIVPEGYGSADSNKMHHHLQLFTSYLLAQEPFKSRSADINVWGIEHYGATTGITDPTRGIAVESSVGASYNTFGSDRYLMTFQLFRLHNLLASAPCDAIVIMANSDTYGGGAIYNFYAISSLHKMASMILPHELGHSIGGLADEYVDEALSYGNMHQPTTEPTEPNITTLVDFAKKWQHLLPQETPVPTPARNEVPRQENGPIGCYEGAGYHAKGIYRPVMHCMMRNYAPFCPVCSQRLNEVIDLYAK